MVASSESASSRPGNRTTSERKSERELIVTRTFDAPAKLVFEAWTTPELLKQWWVPKSSGTTLLSCDQDLRVGSGYHLEIAHHDSTMPMAFFGTYLEIVPNARLVWTNEESEDGGVTALTFQEKDGKTLLVMRELYPTTQALDRAMEGMGQAMPEVFEQLDTCLAARGAQTGRL